MNIFYVSSDPVIAAQSLVDRHVVKMILESAQLLSTAHRVLDGQLHTTKKYVEGSFPPRYRATCVWIHPIKRINQDIYKATHINHPSAKWVRESAENYEWLKQHWLALMSEYAYRYGKHHKCNDLTSDLCLHPKNIPQVPMTPVPCCMPEEYRISNDPLTNYRNYYTLGKSTLHKWTKRKPPEWLGKV